MPRREIPLIAGHYYHVYNRGHNRAQIFFEHENYAFFLRRLRQYVLAEHANLIAYVLMPNHYHLLVHARTDELSHAMRVFGISYTKAINTRYQRTGSLFEGALRAKEVDQDDYLLHLSRYIHLNPVRAGLVRRPEEWDYSSYPDYLGLRSGSLPDPDIVSGQFATRDHYRAFVQAYVPADSDTVAHLLFE